MQNTRRVWLMVVTPPPPPPQSLQPPPPSTKPSHATMFPISHVTMLTPPPALTIILCVSYVTISLTLHKSLTQTKNTKNINNKHVAQRKHTANVARVRQMHGMPADIHVLLLWGSYPRLHIAGAAFTRKEAEAFKTEKYLEKTPPTKTSERSNWGL